MALSAFDDKSRPPEAGELAEVLGRTNSHWHDLTSRAVRLEIRSKKNLEAAKKLAAIKMAN
jgi:hypothetical protein